MNKEVLTSKGFIVKFYLILLFGGLAMIIPIISRVYLAPWCILNVLFMLNVFYAICRFKAKKGLFVVCLLFLLIMTLIIYYYAGGLVCMSILIFGEPLYESDFLSLRIFLHILFWGPATIVYLVYLLLEYIAWKKGYISSRIKHVKWGFNDFCSSYVGMTALAYFPFSYYCILLHILITEPPHMYSTYGSYMLGD